MTGLLQRLKIIVPSVLKGKYHEQMQYFNRRFMEAFQRQNSHRHHKHKLVSYIDAVTSFTTYWHMSHEVELKDIAE
jgi:hypothetical protein